MILELDRETVAHLISNHECLPGLWRLARQPPLLVHRPGNGRFANTDSAALWIVPMNLFWVETLVLMAR